MTGSSETSSLTETQPSMTSRFSEVMEFVFHGDYTGYFIIAFAIFSGWFFGKYGDRIIAYFKNGELDGETERKLAAKRLNEHVKLFGTFCNTVGAAVIGTALIVPYVGQPKNEITINAYLWGMAGLAVHAVGQACLRLMKSEV